MPDLHKLKFELAAIVALLFAGALVEPVLLYFISLLLFGLPHVLTELAFVRRRFHWRGGRLFWRVLAALLVLEAALRLGGAASGLSSATLGMLELLLLSGLLASVLLVSGAGLAARLGAVLLAGGIGLLLHRGEILLALTVFALLHNFTPLAFVLDLAREEPRARLHARWMALVFCLPLLAGFLAWLWPPHWIWHSAFMEERFLAQISGDWLDTRTRIAVLAAAALAQCLHYLAVIRWLPALASSPARPLLSIRGKAAIAVAGIALSILFLLDYGNARWLYGAAAGVHAWLEWPLLVLIIAGWRGTQEAAQPA